LGLGADRLHATWIRHSCEAFSQTLVFGKTSASQNERTASL